MKTSNAITTAIVSVRGSERNSPSKCFMTNKSDNKFITIKITSSKETQPEPKTRVPVTTTRQTRPTNKSQLHPPPPPPPPNECLTVKSLAFQLEYQIKQHTGYIPEGAMPIAFFQTYTRLQQLSSGSHHDPMKTNRESQQFWKAFQSRAKKRNMKKDQASTYFLRLHETEW
jgi:hypothetical protein